MQISRLWPLCKCHAPVIFALKGYCLSMLCQPLNLWRLMRILLRWTTHADQMPKSSMSSRLSRTMMRALPACLLLACCVCHAVAQSQSIPSLRIGAIDESRPNAAMSLQILAYAYAQLGISVIVENYPHQRRRQMAEQGELDGITVAVADLGSDAAGKTSNLIQLSVPIAYDEVAVYTHHQYFKVNGYESLRPYLIGYVRGIKEFEDHTQGMRTEVAPNMESLFRKLVTDRTDVVLESSSSMCMIKRLGLHDIRMLEPAVESVQMYHYLHKKNSSLVPRLEAVLLKMKQDGSMKKIQQKAMDDFLQQCR